MTHFSCRSLSLARVGLFWFIAKDRNPSRFASVSRALVDVPRSENFHRLDATHTKTWPDLRRLDPALEPYDFDYFPRGSVEYLALDDQWLLNVDPTLRRGAFVAYVVVQWNIPPPRLIIRVAHDYQSIARVGPPA